MNRDKFIKKCGLACLGMVASPFLKGCTGTRYITGVVQGSFLIVPQNSFLREDGDFRKYVLVEHPHLQYPIIVFRNGGMEFNALLMRCTHQGTELQAFGDRLQCPAHGSEFTKNGSVKNGPADQDLRSFPVFIESEILKIDLS